MDCAGPATEALDWVTLANGEYGPGTGWAPGTDQELSFSDTRLPFGGTKTTVVTGIDREQGGNPKALIAGSDNGGVAYTDTAASDPYTWVTFNGDGDQLIDGADYAIWGIWAETLDNIYTLSGDERGTDPGEQAKVRGRLRRTTDRGVTWQELRPYAWDSTSSDPFIGVNGALNPWDPAGGYGDGRADAGGDLIIRWSTASANNELLVVSQYYVPDKTPDYSGIYPVDALTGAYCNMPFSGLPMRSTAGDTMTDGLISSLAVAQVWDGGIEGSTDPVLFVGYKLRPENKDALWTCELPAAPLSTCGMTLTCSAVSNTGFDIRDLVVADDVVFVADAGRRWSADDPDLVMDDQDTVEAQVYAYSGEDLALWTLDDTDAGATAPIGS